MTAQGRKPHDRRLTVNLSADSYAKLMRLAAAEDVPATAIIRRALREMLGTDDFVREIGIEDASGR